MDQGTEEPWCARAKELLVTDIGYRALHTQLQGEGFEVGLKKVQKFVTTCRSQEPKEISAGQFGKVAPALFEAKPLPGRGIGLVASLHIAAGTLLISEKPVLRIKDESELPVLFSKLSATEKEEVLALHNQFPREDQIVGIFQTNCIPCALAGSMEAVVERGLFPRIARFNHSCNPNAFYIWSTKLGVLEVKATSDIEPGQEICVSYIDPSPPTFIRQEDFHENFGFKCHCQICSLPEGTEKRAASDRNRTQIMFLRDALSCVADNDTGLRYIQELLALYEKEGLEFPIATGQLALHAFCMIASGNLTSDRITAAKSHAQFAADRYSRIFGNKNEKVQTLRSFVADPSKQTAQKVLRALQLQQHQMT